MIIDRYSLKEKITVLKAQGKKIVFTNGCFDIIHSGHIYYLGEAKKAGDILIIGLNSDNSVRRLKGNDRPVNNESDRAMVLDALKFVDYVTIFEEDTPYELIKLLQPDILVKGGDYNADEIVGADIVRENGGEVLIIPYIKGKSTTELIKKIKS
jgi:D-beta-D-heptose 7-phosphate kinase/D-beta-D-heptose 1-phosphate adenosyltransferase